MKTPNSTKAELSAPDQRDISLFQPAVQRIECFVYGNQSKVLSRPAFENRLAANLIPHSFHPVGDDLHVIPITIDRYPLGCNRSIDTVDATELRSLWLPIWGIDPQHLILGSCLFVDVNGVLDLEGRKRYLVRLSKALRMFNFPQPSGGKCLEKAYREHHRELQRQRGTV